MSPYSVDGVIGVISIQIIIDDNKAITTILKIFLTIFNIHIIDAGIKACNRMDALGYCLW